VSHSEDLEARVAALETQVQQLTEQVQGSAQDAAAARVLAGGADRDVTEIRGEIRDFREQNNRVLSAMRDDLGTVRGDLNDLGSRVDRGFTEMRGKLDATAAGQQQISELLRTLIDRSGETQGDS
jgi:polyhydroxyalkanoate synthesis regulator phasin